MDKLSGVVLGKGETKMNNRELETITFGETQKIANENDIEFSKVFEIICDVRDTLQIKESVKTNYVPSLDVKPKGSRGKYRHHWKSSEIKKLLTLRKKGLTSGFIAKKLNKTPKQVYDKINYELNKN